MKIAFLIDWHLYYTVELANALAQRHEVLLVTRDHNFEISSEDDPVSLDDFLSSTLDASIIREKLRYRRGDIRNVSEVARIRKILARFAPDAIHIQDTTDWRIILLAALCGKGNTVLTIHDVVSHIGESRGVQSALWHALIGLADKVVVHGDFLGRQFVAEYPKLSRGRRVAVIPHGAYSIYKQWDDAAVAEEEKTILFFGRLSRYKGLDILLAAHRLVLKSMPQTRLIIAGKGESLPLDAIKDEQRQNLEIQHRFIPNSEVPRFFRRAAVVVLPYTEASQSGVVPIAYAFGKPVVVTNVGSIPEVVKDGASGFVVAPDDPVALAAALVQILGDGELRRTMAKNAQGMAETELSWDAIAKRTVEVYAHGG